jgi:hypothetical protein
MFWTLVIYIIASLGVIYWAFRGLDKINPFADSEIDPRRNRK